MISDTIEVFLRKYDAKESTNTSSGLHVKMTGKRKLLPVNDTSNVLSQNDQYNKERENCSIIRLTCQVNPVCSNVLFNRITEVVKNEGSEGALLVNYGDFKGTVKGRGGSFWSGNISQRFGTSNSMHLTNSIRDTQLSNSENGYVYHCGLDIFNNHLLRSSTFKTICPGNNTDYFNTLADSMRDVNGERVKETIPFPINANQPNNEKKIDDMHLYEIDDVFTFKDCVKERLVKRFDGWLGFKNKSKVKSYKTQFKASKSLKIERPLMNYNGGDFVDMYPDRSLYSFVPKYNPFRKRVEKNWNYCITYPSSSYTPSNESEPFSEVIDYELKSMKVTCFNENTRQDNGTKQIVIYSVGKHGLKPGDYVNIYKSYMSGDTRISEKILDNAEVSAVADEFIFTLFTQDVQISKKWTTVDNLPEGYSVSGKYVRHGESYYRIVGDDIANYVNIDDDAQDISYKKVVNDIECDYYVRIFSRLPNFKFASGDTSNEYEIYRDRGGYNMIDTYSGHEYEFENHISRLAFAKNIYTDEIGEVVFTDDINIANIKDNLGRPLSELYLTIIKNNAGYKEWYGFSNVPISIGSENVEYSHCFGKVKCGIEMGYMCNDERYPNNINRLTYSSFVPVEGKALDAGYDIEFLNGERELQESDEVSFKNDIHYYGDISYFDNYNSIERHLQPVMQRVNTAQRESVNSSSKGYFSSYVYDEIIHDDYDINEEYTVASYSINGANNHDEGYYYIPHYQIPIRTFGLLNTAMPDFLKMRSLTWCQDGNGDNVAKIATLQNHYLTMGDKAVIYDRKNHRYFYCVTVDGSGITWKPDSYKVFTCKIYDKNGKPASNDQETGIPNLITGMTEIEDDSGFGDITDFSLFKLDNIDAPSYAKILEDGTCRVIWRDILNNGFAVDKNEIEEYPFTNGAFYVHKRVDLYLRRQDPYSLYELYEEDDVEGNDIDVINEDNYYKEDEVEC